MGVSLEGQSKGMVRQVGPGGWPGGWAQGLAQGSAVLGLSKANANVKQCYHYAMLMLSNANAKQC